MSARPSPSDFRAAFDRTLRLSHFARRVLAARPEVEADVHVEEVTRLLARDPAVLVRQNGDVVGILTRFDMLQFIAGVE